jgi:hypothetical protein
MNIDVQDLDVPTTKPKVSVIMDPELKEALEAWAEAEERTVSKLCEMKLRKAAKEAGYLKADQE